MRAYVYGFSISLSDDETRLLKDVIHQYLTGIGEKKLFDEMTVAGETSGLVDVYSHLNYEAGLTDVTGYEVSIILTALKTVYKKFPIDAIQNLITDFTKLQKVHYIK